jgi:hypothetical protein
VWFRPCVWILGVTVYYECSNVTGIEWVSFYYTGLGNNNVTYRVQNYKYKKREAEKELQAVVGLEGDYLGPV